MRINLQRRFDTLLPADPDAVTWMANLEDGERITLDVVPDQRTLPQNNAMHKYFRMVADALNACGAEMHIEITFPWGKTLRVPWTADLFKERVWLPIMRAQTEKTSTAKLTTVEVDQIYQIVSRYLAEETGVITPFPRRDQ